MGGEGHRRKGIHVTNLPTRLREWATSFGRRDPEPELDARPTQTIEELRRTTAATVVAMDDAIRASARELETARAQVGGHACRRFVATLESARRLADDALARHREAVELAGSGADDTTERIRLSQVIDLARRVDELLDGDAEEFARLRDLRTRAPQLLEALVLRAGEVEHEAVAADDELARLRADHPADSLVRVAGNPDRARELATAARRLVDEGRAHLADRDDRAAAVVAARGAEAALHQARAELREVAEARSALATAREDVRAALASIRSDLADARRLEATDATTTAALERAHPVIDSAETALAEGGDLLGALAELTTAEQAIDDALAEHRDADDQRRRAHTRLERRVRNAEAFVAGVDRRLASSVAGTADNRSAISRAGHLVEEARTHLTDDPEAATLRLDEAMALGQAIQAELDEAAREATARYYAEDRHRSGAVAEMTVDALAAGLIGLLSLGWGGSSSGGSSSGASGFGGGGRF